MVIRIVLFALIVSVYLLGKDTTCKLPKNIYDLWTKESRSSLYKIKDVKRNKNILSTMCMFKISIKEKPYLWEMLLIYNPKKPKGAFWFLPHDDENTAFDTAVYSAYKYGGGFLSVISNDKRYFQGQDPNRNFGETREVARTCPKQKYPAALFSKYVFQIVDTYRAPGMPYLAMHNNKNGWYGNGGSGTISILTKSSKVKSYRAGSILQGKRKGIKDEDSLVYIAGKSKQPRESVLEPLLQNKLHTKYEVVNVANNDCSMSNYVVLKKGGRYYNIEAEHGDARAQRAMVDRLMRIIR